MTSRAPARLRRQVIERARNCCEYCLLHQDFAASIHQIDHVIAEEHGGRTSLDYLALSCSICNRRKGSDISSTDPETGAICPLFNPRTQIWQDHFQLEVVRIVGLTPERRTTIKLLRLNSFERLAERGELILAGRFSPESSP